MIFSKLADGVRQRFPANDGREVAILFTMSGYGLSGRREKGNNPLCGEHTLLPQAVKA